MKKRENKKGFKFILKVDGFMVVRLSRGRLFTKHRTNFGPAALFTGNRLIFNFR